MLVEKYFINPIYSKIFYVKITISFGSKIMIFFLKIQNVYFFLFLEKKRVVVEERMNFKVKYYKLFLENYGFSIQLKFLVLPVHSTKMKIYSKLAEIYWQGNLYYTHNVIADI